MPPGPYENEPPAPPRTTPNQPRGTHTRPPVDAPITPRPVIPPPGGGYTTMVLPPQGQQPFAELYPPTQPPYNYTPPTFPHPCGTYPFTPFTFPGARYTYMTHPMMQGQYSTPGSYYVAYPPPPPAQHIPVMPNQPTQQVDLRPVVPQLGNPARNRAGPTIPVRNLDEDFYEVRTKDDEHSTSQNTRDGIRLVNRSRKAGQTRQSKSPVATPKGPD